MNFPDSSMMCRVPVNKENPMNGRARVPRAKKLLKRERNAGFTLIEICAVVGIISILAGISLFGVKSYRDKAKTAQALAELDRITKAIFMLQLDTGRWPGGQVPGLPAGAGNEVSNLNAASAGLCAANSNFPNWNGPYYSPCPVPKDPWGENYIYDTDYTLPTGQKRTVVHSGGPNKSGVNVYDDDNPIKIIQ
jgi:general secretion pathway protein G